MPPEECSQYRPPSRPRTRLKPGPRHGCDPQRQSPPPADHAPAPEAPAPEATAPEATAPEATAPESSTPELPMAGTSIGVGLTTWALKEGACGP